VPKRSAFLLVWWLWLAPAWCLAQVNGPLSNRRCQWLRPQFTPDSAGGYRATLRPDTLSLLPDSTRLLRACAGGRPLSLVCELSHQPIDNTLIIKWLVAPLPDSVEICYRVLPHAFAQKIFNRDQAKYDSGGYHNPEVNTVVTAGNDPAGPPALGQRAELFKAEGLQKSGSLTRGLSFGNRQDVFVQSALNLQMEGKITEDLHLTAVLTDQNIPFQPEGNTQQLQQFDRVFIKLTHPVVNLSAGDVVLQNPSLANGRPQSQFLRFYKNVLGAVLETTPRRPAADSSQRSQKLALGQTRVGLAAAKGRFFSQVVPVQEGVLGPYRLRGPEGDRFIIILANSERVYLDNRLLTRGFNYDYVIDYNTAEITFTNRVVVTRFSRVRVDMEYNVQNYPRSILTASHYQPLGRFTVFGQFYRERDNPNNPLLANLDTAGRRLLARVGDSVQNALAPAIQPAEWNVNRVLYTARDTVADGRTYRAYVRARGPQEPNLFSLTFSEVGPGRGDYLPGSPTANGREYLWVAPRNGVSQGNYAPVRLLPAPNQRQMAVLGASFQLSKAEHLFGEMAFSQFDPNLYATLGNADNAGQALKFGYTNTGKPLNIKVLPNWQWLAHLDYERDNANFRPVDRFRDIEFDRDWSLDFQNGALDLQLNTSPGQGETVAGAPLSSGRVSAVADQLVNAGAGLRKNAAEFVSLRHIRRQRGAEANGYQQTADLGARWGRWHLLVNFFTMRNRFTRQGEAYRSTWDRLRTELSYRGQHLVPGYVYATDRNVISRVRPGATDSVAATAMHFAEHRFYLKNGDSSRWQFGADFSFRQDELPVEGRLRRTNQANTLNVTASRQTKTQYFSLIATYRNLATLAGAAGLPSPGLRQPGNDETITGRLDWNAQFWRGAVRSELTLQNGSGRELRREFTYLPVNPGQGTHTWRDDNADGLQQLNEFYLAINPDERNFIKVFTPTDQYINAFTNALSYRLNAGFPKDWAKRGGLRTWLLRLSNVSSWTINKRLTDRRLLPRFLPWAPATDSLLLGEQNVLRSAFFYNRTNPKFGLEISLFRSEQKQLLTNGFEGRQQRDFQASLRYNLGPALNARLAAVADERGSRSDFLANRNYLVTSRQVRPELAWQPSPNFRLAGIYEWKNKQNLTGEERAVFHEASLDLRWAKESQRTVNLRLRLANIAFAGAANTPVGYEMLEALQNGRNYTWTANWQQRLSNGLQLTFQYEGRSSPGQTIVHIGRAQVTALF
jgi:hypothetical protein